MKWKQRTLLALMSVAVLGAAGCAEEREPINKVQPDALKKEFFVGKVGDPSDDPEFYWRNFVVDGSEAQSMIGIGSWSGVDRIRWDIQKDLLVARKAYGIADGADDKGGDGHADGTIVAAYTISSHFDIRREYNPATGEDYNVIVENTSDRPWEEREYMRVDWSINLVDTPMWNDMFAGKVFGDIKVTPIAYYVSDRSHPDAPHFDAEKGYFDVTSKFWVEPSTMESPFTDLQGKVPACIVLGLYTGASVENCDPQEAVIRSSYLKVAEVDRDGDFEPLENTKASLDIIGNPGGLGSSMQVGIVTPPRIEWDPQYGYTDENMKSFMHHHDIWQQSHQTRGTCTADAECQAKFGGGACLPSGTCSVPCSYDARGDADSNGTDDQCENAVTGYAGAKGSQCSARDRCTIPYRDRKLSTVGYWMNAETPPELTDPVDGAGNPVGRGPTEDLIFSWNQLMKFSVAKAREVECRATGDGDRAACSAQFFEAGQTEMVSFGAWDIERVKPLEDEVLVACHNPVRAYDHPVCGEPGYSARVGDLRHNFLYYWPYASRAPWGGIANWNADPLTGQIIGASATTMGRSATYAAAMVRDIIMVANGELTMSEITDGTSATLYEKDLQNGHVPRALTKEELQKRHEAIDAEHAMEQVAPKLASGGIAHQMNDFHLMLTKTQAGVGPASTSHLEFEAIANKVRGSQVEAQLVDPSWAVDAAGMSSSVDLSQVMDVVSPLRGMDQGQMQLLEQLVDLRMQARGICFHDVWAGNVGNLDVQGVAKLFAQKYGNDAIKANFPELAEADDATLSKKRAELIYQEIWKETYKGIALHEVGHSLGMLHQFASSYDSPNFLPQYWQLRTQEGAATESCNGSPRSGDTFDHTQDSCMGPRYLDPETDDELGRAGESRPGIHYFGHTSTMEYQNERFFETVGLGQYDMLAMNALYGRVLQTFDPDRKTLFDAPAPGAGVTEETQLAFATRHMTQLSELNLVNYADDLGKKLGIPGVWTHSMHYTEQARRMQVFDPARCRDATPEERAHAQWRIVHGKVCSPPPKDYAFWRDFEDGVPTGAPDYATSVKWRVMEGKPAAGGNVRWPYRWGVTSNSYAHTNPSDAGADIYEVTKETIRKFEYSYPFSYFRRQNRDWYYRNVPARTSRGFFDRLRAFHWSMAVNNGRFRGFGDSAYQVIAQADDWWRPYVVAETEMFSAIAKALLAPQIGQYNPLVKPVDSVRQLWDVDDGSGQTPPPFEIDASTGRFIDPDFNSDPSGGGSWEYQSWVNHTGFTVEKADAAKALTDGRAVLFTIARENYLDGRNVNVNFRTDMPVAMDRLLGGLLSGDWETIAPFVMGSDGFNPAVRDFDLGVDTPARPSGALLLFPNVGYKQQLGALVWAHVFARLNTDLGLANKMRVWIDGMVGEITVPESQQIRFYDPETGYTYIARKYGPQTIDGKVVDKGIASRMLSRANALLAAAYQVERDSANKPVLDQFGMPKLVLDAEGYPISTGTLGATNDLRGYVGLLDSAVQVQNMVGYGPFDGLPNEFD